MSEEELVQALRECDESAMEVLYEKYSIALFSVIFRIVKNREVAEDVLQEAFLKIWHSFNSYDNQKGRLYTWMLNICKNLAIDKTRSKSYRNQGKNQDIENNVFRIDSEYHESLNPEWMDVEKIMSSLDKEYARIVEWVYFKGYTHVEAAEALNMPLGTLKTRLRKAIADLREIYLERNG